MKAKKKELFEYEDDQFYPLFEYINNELDLLFILIFLECFHHGKDVLNFADFFKGNYWDIDDVRSEISDTNDFYSIPDMVMEQTVFIFEDTRMGKILEVGIDDLDGALEDVLVQIASIGSENAKKEAPNYTFFLDQLYFLKDLQQKKQMALMEANPDKIGEIIRNKNKDIFFSKDETYFKKLQPIAMEAPKHILFRVIYNEVKVQEIEDEVLAYLTDFSKDKYLEQEKLPRLHFTEQIENFYRYISRLNLIGDTVNVPFTILTETGFEAVKIFAYLQTRKVIKIRWSDEGSWKVQFLKLPITPDSLLGLTKTTEPAVETKKLKADLSFKEATSILTIDGNEIKIQGADQKELLRIMFEEPDQLGNEWFFSEIGELNDFANHTPEKKFYNAAYQLKLKVAQNTPIKDFFITTNQSVRLNPKYL
jgi:hypothetical protein